MSAKVVLGNCLVLAAIGLLGAVRGRPGVSPVMAGASELTTLEDLAALSPSAESFGTLAVAYLDRGQPGLASAVLERAGREIQNRPEIARIRARALLSQGRSRDALDAARRAHDACGDGATCSPWFVAKSARQLAFLEELVAAGVDDPHESPSATLAAYHRSSRELRLVAIR